MTQEDKNLLLKDLCARLPYGVKVNYLEILCDVIAIKQETAELNFCKINKVLWGNLEYIKPYLRPMSSMTEEERKDWYSYSRAQYDCEFHPYPTLSLFESHLSVDWLVAHHFDYRGLIEKGLALEAPEGMYKTE